jgi:hypothetical protein
VLQCKGTGRVDAGDEPGAPDSISAMSCRMSLSMALPMAAWVLGSFGSMEIAWAGGNQRLRRRCPSRASSISCRYAPKGVSARPGTSHSNANKAPASGPRFSAFQPSSTQAEVT